MKTKIAYIVSTLMQCGPTNQIYNLIKHLDTSKYEPIVITISPEPYDSKWKDFEELGIELHSFGLSRMKGLFFKASKLNEFLSKLGIDIIHTHGIRADIMSAKYLRDHYNTVATLRNYPFHDNMMKFGKGMGYLISLYHIKMLKKIRFPVSVSNSTSRMLAVNNLTANVIQNGVDTELFHPISDNLQKQQLRKKLNIPLNKKVFVSAGYLIALKDPMTIVRAFQNENLKENCCVVFLGDGLLIKSCLEQTQKDKNIEFKGRVVNVREYLQASDFFISAAKTEGLPNTVIEAMACGLPCVLSDINPHQEIVHYNKKSAKLFKTKNVNSLVNEINELIKNSYAEASNSALDIAQNHLNAKLMSDRYQQLYDSILC